MATLSSSYDGITLFTSPSLKYEDRVDVAVVGDGNAYQFAKPVKASDLHLIAQSLGFHKYQIVETLARRPASAETPKLAMFVYFIQPVDGGLIKIGKSYDPKRRLSDIQLYSPVKLQILAATSHLEEQAMHKMFAAERVHGEWFQPSDRLLALISEVAEQGEDY